ncbi:MAG: hypothetical protein DHS20C03_19040 [Minwuia thermotolerans]|nr:MAG: hypothetical protein DHS20C03_19040 [Minwuia thermotolerans]
MAKITFCDLVQVYRNTQFDGNGQGDLTVTDEGIAATLRAIEADERLYDDTHLSLVDPADPVVGSSVRINVASPNLSLGFLAADFDALFQAPKAAFTEPENYYVIDKAYARGDDPTPDALVKYRALLNVIMILRESASYSDDVKRELVFLGTEKVILPISFRSSDFSDKLVEQARRLEDIFKDPLHCDEKMQFLSAAVVSLTAGQRVDQRFSYLLLNIDHICDEIENGYRLFVSNFSYSKIRNDLEAAKIDYINKIHKTIVDIQGQLLGIPIATIVVASQLKPTDDFGTIFWMNSSILLGAWAFFVLLTLAVINQWHTLSTLSHDIEAQKKKFRNEYLIIADKFDDIFSSLSDRIKWHKCALRIIISFALLGIILSHVAYFSLTEFKMESGIFSCKIIK